MPVLAVGAGACADRCDDLNQILGTGRMPEADGLGIEIDLVGDVMPDAWFEGCVPL